MKIIIDLIHPANYHYFKNFMKIMKDKGHEIIISARDKDVLIELLEIDKINYFLMGKPGKGALGKILFTIASEYNFLKFAQSVKPDILMSFGSSYVAHVSKLIGKPHITFDDTEHAKLNKFLYKPFTDVILTPSCFTTNLGANQHNFNSYMELCYLHPNYFVPDKSVLDIMNLKEEEDFVIMRFISWDAAHDLGQSGLSTNIKKKAVQEVSKICKVFISSEASLPPEFEKYKLNIPKSKIHDALFFSSLYFGEGGTMASESAVLGTPAIMINSLTTGYLDELEKKYKLIFKYLPSIELQLAALSKALFLIKTPGLRNEWSKRREKMLNDKIDPTHFMVDFVQNFKTR